MTLSPDLELHRSLEWDRLISLAQGHAYSFTGKARLAALAESENWASNLFSARMMQSETQETMALLDRDSLWGPLSELEDPAPVLERLEKGAVLELAEMGLLRRWLYATDSWTQIPREEIRGERLKKALALMPDPTDALRILDTILTPEGELSEKASPRLSGLYSEIRSLKKEISTVLDRLLKTLATKGVLQENFTDVRDGRYVIPIKISCQNEIPGIIYEASASRQTVFVEPAEVGQLNNRLRQRQNDLLQEIYSILEAASKKLQPFCAEFTTSVEILTHWDAVQAKARIGRHYSGKTIQVSDERRFVLRQTAHPLLWWSLKPESIIRNEIDFGAPAKALLITGPNTGGKTVLLKTLGLAGICARTGFPFPGSEQPVVPFFDSFFVDVGDPQSIEASLSSFSGHILRFKEILARLTRDSLVLLDELNSSTDPEEGAALGRAVLETLMSQDAMIVSTTHDPHLKALSITDQRIFNASMAFDEMSRSPTYRMVLGVPGRSRALETAERLGIPKGIIELAKKYLSKEHLEFESLLTKLQSDAEEATRARKEAVAVREEAERLKKEWTERTSTSVTDMMDRLRNRLRRILEQAQDDVRATVRRLDEVKSRKEVDTARGRLNDAMKSALTSLEGALSEEAPEIALNLPAQSETPSESTENSSRISVGSVVRVPRWKTTETVLEIAHQKIKVAIGTLQILLSPDQIEVLENAQVKQATRLKVSTSDAEGSSPAVPPSQLDIRGQRFDEAMGLVEKYLDQAFRSGSLQEVTIIHGLGTGALREGTQRLLASLPYIKGYRSGGVGHGGTGATIVEFELG